MENKIKEVKESNSNAFSYNGDIHVKIVEDNRIYYENYFHSKLYHLLQSWRVYHPHN